MNFKKLASALCVLAVSSAGLSGCFTMETYSSSKKSIKSAQSEVAEAPSFDNGAAVYITQPVPEIEPIVRPEGPDWLYADLSVEVAQLPIDVTVESFLSRWGVVSQFDHGTSPSIPVSLQHKGNVKGALDKLAARTNYSYSVTDEIVKWQAYETATFTLPMVGGDYNYMVGKKRPEEMSEQMGGGQSGMGGGGVAVDTSAFDVDRKQYSSTEAEALNPFEDAEKTITQIVGDYGLVVPSKSSSTILVKTTPDRMSVVRSYMDSLIKELSAQVLLEIKVIQVTTNKNADVGINWAAIKDQTRSQLNFIGESAGMFTDAVPVAFSGVRETNSGSIDVLVSALEQQGKVSFVTEQRVLTRSGKVAELELADIKGYLAQSRTTQTADIGSTVELIPGIIQGGYTLYALSKVVNDQVAMIISTRSSTLDPVETIGSADNFIQLPRMKSNRFNLQQMVTSGTTVVAAALRREEAMNAQSSPLRVGLASTQAGARHQVTDIYLLITPRIIKSI